MKISTKMSLSVTIMGMLLFGTYGFLLIRSERMELRTAVERELTLFSRTFEVAAKNALRDRQLADIQETMERIENTQDNLEILFYDAQDREMAKSRNVKDNDTLYTEVLNESAKVNQLTMKFDPPDDPKQVGIAVPLTNDLGEIIGSMVVVRPLDDMRRDLRTTTQGILLSVALFVLGAAILSSLLSFKYIRQPLGHLIEAMRGARDGDFASMLPISSQDEMGQLTEEFNIMMVKLRDAREKIEESEEAKVRLERVLQRADKLVTIGQISAGLAHEIGSPLQILNGRARALLASPQNAEETRHNAEILVAETDRITKIVEQLLQMTRKRPPQMEEIDLLKTVHTVIDVLQVEARHRKVSISVKCDLMISKVLADPHGIQQVILNLVTNSFTAMPKGGQVTITIVRSTIRDLSDGTERPSLKLTIEDTGCGISPENLDRIFEPFFTTRAAESGTGLGLAVVKTIISEHHGIIHVESKVGIGTRFDIELPLANPLLQREVVI